MSEIVERVTKALEKEFESCRRVFDKGQAEGLARAAIEAMREPTEAMMAAVNCAGEKAEWLAGKMHKASYQAMIDEALK